MPREIQSAQTIFRAGATDLLPRQEEAHKNDERRTGVYSSQNVDVVPGPEPCASPPDLRKGSVFSRANMSERGAVRRDRDGTSALIDPVAITPVLKLGSPSRPPPLKAVVLFRNLFYDPSGFPWLSQSRRDVSLRDDAK